MNSIQSNLYIYFYNKFKIDVFRNFNFIRLAIAWIERKEEKTNENQIIEIFRIILFDILLNGIVSKAPFSYMSID